MQGNEGSTDTLIRKLANLLNKGDPESSELLSVLDEIRVQGFSKTSRALPQTPKEEECSEFAPGRESQEFKSESSYTSSLSFDD